MRNTRYEMKKAFTLVEILIVVAILGILAAIALPTFQDHITEAKEAAAKDNLRILRNAIELYAARNNGVAPGYALNNPDWTVVEVAFYWDLVRGNYISERPTNPFNNLKSILMIGNEDSFPAEATGEYGWIYKPATKNIRLDWPGTDLAGTPYYDY